MGTATVVLPPGKYYLQALYPGAIGSGCPVLINAYARYPVLVRVQDTNNISRLAGGLRIRRTEEVDGLDASRNQLTTYQYGTYTPNEKGQRVFQSSGVLVNRPVFKKTLHHSLGEIADGHGSAGAAIACGSLQFTSYSNVCFSAGAKGSSVGYRQVTVLRGARGQEGKKDYYFNCLVDRTLEYENPVPNVPTRSDDLNGYPLAEITYRWSTGEGYLPVNRVDYQYRSPADQYQYDLPAISRGSSWTVNSGTTNPLTATYFYYYPIPVRWVRLQQSSTTIYDPADVRKSFVTTTRYTYDTLNVGHRQVSLTRTQRSDGSTQVTTTTYPADYTGLSSGPLAAMRSDAVYQHSLPVETVTQVYGPGQTLAQAQVLSGLYTEYTQPTSTSRYLPRTINTLDVVQPTAGLAPSFTALTLPQPGRYRLREELRYDPVTANLQQVRLAHDTPLTYLWGYRNTLPVAEIKNATPTQVQAALTAAGITLGPTATATELQAASTQLRRRLPQAQVTSFTHRPLVGIASQTDPSGRAVTYEYDGLGRLVRTRDEQGRILSQQQYHYAGN